MTSFQRFEKSLYYIVDEKDESNRLSKCFNYFLMALIVLSVGEMALETDDEMQNAQKKLQSKNFDFIVLNSLKDKGAGFGYDTNKVTIVSRTKGAVNYDLKSKALVAKDIADQIEEEFSQKVV